MAEPKPKGPRKPQALEGGLPEFDKLIHERLSFNELKALLATSDGNLSVHARKLEEAGYVSCDKYIEGRMPKTEYRLTDAGRDALGRYLGHMEALINTMRDG